MQPESYDLGPAFQVIAGNGNDPVAKPDRAASVGRIEVACAGVSEKMLIQQFREM